MAITIRPMEPAEYPLLDTFLYHAIFLPEGVEPPPFSIVEQPELRVYTQDFGTSPHDRALVADRDGEIIGAVWVRIMDDYGHIDEDTPSLAISLLPAYRGQGTGTALMRAMLHELREAGYAQVSLSVQAANAAVRLYKRLGFTVLRAQDEELIMCCTIR
ncbi:MAG: GNAT family N-acetyltransferase [Oscillospiraceae bacterium]|nr:GNAT family N-acetyltransferase [Oscillospiraceae bacterium]